MDKNDRHHQVRPGEQVNLKVGEPGGGKLQVRPWANARCQAESMKVLPRVSCEAHHRPGGEPHGQPVDGVRPARSHRRQYDASPREAQHVSWMLHAHIRWFDAIAAAERHVGRNTRA